MTFGCLLGLLWDPLGTLWVSIGSLWVPFGPLWGHFGGPWPPLGPMLVTLASFWGPLTAERAQNSDEERCWEVVFVNSLIYSASFLEA